MKKIIIVLFLSLLFVACTGLDDYSKDVKYEVTGTASAVDLTIENNNGGTSQYSDKSLPWTYSFTGYPGDFIYVSAQNQGDSGSVTATIYIDGEQYKTSTSDGAYVIATASGSIPAGLFNGKLSRFCPFILGFCYLVTGKQITKERCKSLQNIDL